MEMVIYELINLMRLAETIKSHQGGQRKKEFVLEQINKKLEGKEELKEFIEILIDFIILLDKNEIKINKVVKKSFFKCLECFNIK